MTSDHAAEQLHELAKLLDRARESARAEGHDLEVLLAEASQTLRNVEPALGAAPAHHRSALAVAARRARASQLALEQTLREELARVGRQLAQTSPSRHGRYSTAPSTAHNLDKVG